MIDRDAKPFRHDPVYRRINPAHPGRKPIITALEIIEGGGRGPDPALYRYDPYSERWILKEGM